MLDSVLADLITCCNAGSADGPLEAPLSLEVDELGHTSDPWTTGPDRVTFLFHSGKAALQYLLVLSERQHQGQQSKAVVSVDIPISLPASHRQRH